MAQEIQDLQGWWKLDNNSNDSSDTGINGVDTNITYQTGKINQSALFNGTTSKIVITPSSLTIRSIAFWMKATSNTSDIIKLSSTAKVSIDASNIITTTGLTNTTTYVNAVAGTTVATSSWYFVVITFDQITTSAMELGHETSYYTGELDDVRVYDKALTTTEIAGLYNNGNGIKTNNLVRIIYEQTGLLGNDIASDSKLVIADQDELDNAIFTMIPSYQVVANDEFQFYDYNNKKIFAGYIREVNSDNAKTLTCYEYLVGYQDRIVNDIFNSVSPEGLFQTIVTTYAPDSEFTFSSSISSGITIPQYVSKNKTALDIMQDMADLLQGTIFYSDVNKVIHLEFLGASVSAQTIQEGVNANNVTGIIQDTSKQVTRLTLIGDKQVDTVTDSYTASASQTDFVLSEIPKTVEVTVNGTAKTLQQTGTNTGDFILDKDNKTVTFLVAMTGGESVVIKSTFELNIKVEADSSLATQDKYGIIEKKLTKKFIQRMDEAYDYATDYLDKFSVPLKRATYEITTTLDPTNFSQGDAIFTEDFSYRDIEGVQLSENLIIRKIEREFPAGGLKVTVGENENNMLQWGKELSYNIKQLYEDDDNSTIIQKYQQFTNPVKQQFDIDVTDIIQRTWNSDAFYALDDELGTRNQATNAGTYIAYDEGNGYSTSDLDGSNDDLVAQVGTDSIVAQNGTDNVVAQSSTDTNLDVGFVTALFRNTARTNFISTLAPLVTHLAVGDNTTTPAEGDTTLGNETYREAKFSSSTSTNSARWTIRLDTTENNGNTINEIGLFDAASGGTMYTRDLTTSFAKTSAKEAFYVVVVNFSTEAANLS